MIKVVATTQNFTFLKVLASAIERYWDAGLCVLKGAGLGN